MRPFAEAIVARLTPAQRADALGAVNRYYAYLLLGRTPSDEEALSHYLTQTGPHFTVHEFQVWPAHEQHDPTMTGSTVQAA